MSTAAASVPAPSAAAPAPLKGLRLNAVLAPLSAALVGALALAIGAWWQAEALERQRAAHEVALVRLLADWPGEGLPPLAAWQAAGGWAGAACLRVREERVELLAEVGRLQLPGEPLPQWLDAFSAPQRWRDAEGLVTVALPRFVGAEPPYLVVAQRPEDAAAAGWWPWAALAAGTLAFGALLGLYLVQRVYRPVQWMEQALAAAAAGREPPPDEVTSEETASLRSSLAVILARRRAGGESDAGAAPP